MSEQTATRFQDLLDLLNLQDEDGASAAASAEKLLHLTNEKFNLLMVGATGSGKSSTINALFDTQVAEVGTGVDPETASIDCYALDNFCIWDTPGLGDGVENDIAIAKAIKAKLSETDPEGAQVVDMVLIVLDASTKDLGTVYTLLNVDRAVPEVWGSKYDVREILRACYYAIDKKPISEAPLSFKEKEMLKVVLKKVKGTDIEILLRESGLIE